MQSFLRRLSAGECLSRDEASRLFALLVDGATDAQIGAVLGMLTSRGESSEELAGFANAMRSRMIRVRSPFVNFVDTAGTGSSRAKTFNVSTAAAFVIAAAGLPIAKHGGRAATSVCGSADVLGALGVALTDDVLRNERMLAELGICFLFAPLHHPASARVASIRRELGIRTTFNLVGPLCNPASAPFQVLGVSEASLLQIMASALAKLGSRSAWVVHGEDGLDELTLAGKTRVAEVRGETIREFVVTPEDFGIEQRPCNLRAGDAEASAKLIVEVLSGESGAEARDLVLLNAAAALCVGLGLECREAAARARNALQSGAALAKLKAVQEFNVGEKA